MDENARKTPVIAPDEVRDGTFPPTEGDTATQRLLTVLQAIAEHGPISHSALCDRLPISRSAIWRAALLLRAQGWLRIRPGDKAYELTCTLDRLMAGANFQSEEAEEIAPHIRMVQEMGPFHVDFGCFIARGQFVLLESTRATACRRSPLSLVFDEGAVAAQIVMDRPQVLRHLRAFLDRATEEERRAIESGEHGRVLDRLGRDGIVWAMDRRQFSLPWQSRQGTAGALTITLRADQRRDMLPPLVATLRGVVPGLSPKLN